MVLNKYQLANLMVVQSGVIKGLDQIQQGRLASGSGADAIERALENALKSIRRRSGDNQL